MSHTGVTTDVSDVRLTAVVAAVAAASASCPNRADREMYGDDGDNGAGRTAVSHAVTCSISKERMWNVRDLNALEMIPYYY